MKQEHVKQISIRFPLDLYEQIDRRAAIHAALGSARSFYTHLSKWRRGREKAQAKGKKWTKRPPRPPRTWNNMILPMGTRLGVKGQSLDPHTYTREQTVGQIIRDSGYQEVERDSSC